MAEEKKKPTPMPLPGHGPIQAMTSLPNGALVIAQGNELWVLNTTTKQWERFSV